ncbi:hypothetical protein ANANG_G00081360, partial [Anguilla anguilla]
CPDICVNGQIIKNVDEFKYLGVTLDPTLDFKKHIKKMDNTLKFNLANFRHVRNSLTVEASKTYLNAMILSHFSYCMSSWSQANKTALRPLKSLYKSALKIHDKKTRQYHHCHVLTKYNMLNLENFIMYSSVCLIFKIIHNAAPPPLRNFVTLSSKKQHEPLDQPLGGSAKFHNARPPLENHPSLLWP